MGTSTATKRRNTLGEQPDERVDCGPLGTVVVPGEWIDLLVGHNDIFRTDHAGYWLFAAACVADRATGADKGWICYEQGDGPRPTVDECQEAENTIDDGGTLVSPGWFFLDRAFAIKAYLEGAKRWGVDWYHDGKTDATRYDVAVQLAALGEVRYG